jgi:hypothetical protein
MLSNSRYDDGFKRLTEQIRLASALTANLIHNIISETCTRLPMLTKAGKATRIEGFIEAGAWSDAAFALIEFELPAWRLRRLAYDDSEWLCSLTTQPHLPLGLDDTADASHQVLPLAILLAFVEARRRMSAGREASLPIVPQIRVTPGYSVCCENFS